MFTHSTAGLLLKFRYADRSFKYFDIRWVEHKGIFDKITKFVITWKSFFQKFTMLNTENDGTELLHLESLVFEKKKHTQSLLVTNLI